MCFTLFSFRRKAGPMAAVNCSATLSSRRLFLGGRSRHANLDTRFSVLTRGEAESDNARCGYDIVQGLLGAIRNYEAFRISFGPEGFYHRVPQSRKINQPVHNRPPGSRMSSRHGLIKGFDLVDFLIAEAQFASAHDTLCLSGITGPDAGAGHGGMAQRPGDRDFANETVVALGYLSHMLDQRQIVRETWFRKVGMPSAPVILG